MAQILIIGSGGREHALAWALARSPHITRIYINSGNGGTQWPEHIGPDAVRLAEVIPLQLGLADAPQWAQASQIDLTVVGPEVPLAEGIVDQFQALGLAIFGPTQAAAQIEASKAFAKNLMVQQNIPTGEYFVADSAQMAQRFLEGYAKPVVIKADGLAAGKGVIVTDTREQASKAVQYLLQDRAFGAASDTILIEERLTGREASVLAFCDGRTLRPMVVARDYKRIGDGDTGPNTGGMGAIAPANDLSPVWVDEVVQRVLQPAIDGLAALGSPFVGVLYAGVMNTPDGIKVLEFNARFGDPETQVILPLLKTDLYEVLQACVQGRLHEITLEWHAGYCATVVMASEGYPNAYPKGLPITGLDTALEAGVVVFHAGTKRLATGQTVTDGGRVLAVTARDDSLQQALDRAYQAVKQIRFQGAQYRRDIGR